MVAQNSSSVSQDPSAPSALCSLVNGLIERIGLLWQKYSEIVLLIGCFLVPLKLALTYLFFLPAIFGWICLNRRQLAAKVQEYAWFSLPWLALIVSIAAHSAFGFLPLRSLRGMYGLIFYPVIMLAIADTFRGNRSLLPLLALLGAQTLAGVHSILDASTGLTLPRFFLGAVTESGQLALVAPIVCGVAVTLHRFTQQKLKVADHISRAGLAALITSALCVCSFSGDLFGISFTIAGVVTLLFLSALIAGYARINQPLPDFGVKERKFLSAIPSRVVEGVFVPILLAALIVNLKRGPWAGAIVGFSLFALRYSRRLVIPLVIAVAIVLAVAKPVRERLLESSQDFFIAGGRSAIWQVGLELAERFPLGIGFKNSKFLHSYSAEIPEELTHFHNNFINILVESGVMSLILFALWIAAVVRHAFTARVSPVLKPTATAIGCALVSWQVAGLVEYNFGDSEVLFVVWVILGALAGMEVENSKCSDRLS